MIIDFDIHYLIRLEASMLFLFKNNRKLTHFISLTIFLLTIINTTWSNELASKASLSYQSIHHPVIGRKGMVVAQNKVAANVGMQILKKGGNAIDAAVAVGFALAVTLPRAGNIGGGGFMMAHHANTNTTVAIDYYSQTPANITPDLFSKTSSIKKYDKQLAYTSYKSVAVPGTVAGLWKAHHRFGKLPWKDLVEPAIALADQGVQLTDDDIKALEKHKQALLEDPEAARVFFKPKAQVYQVGEYFKQPELAWSLTQIRDYGKEAFYKGELAKKLISGIRKQGGILTLQDLANYKVHVSQPIWSTYRNHQIASPPPPAAGIVIASIMNVLEHFPLKQFGANTVASLHIIAEAIKLGRQDLHFIGNHPQWRTPIFGLIDKQHAAHRISWISLKKTLDPHIVQSSHPLCHDQPDTTHYSIADAEGNVVSNTYTLSNSFGAHVVAPGTGILLNNTLTNLAWKEAHAIRKKSRAPLPNTRITSTISPLIIFKKGKPWLVTGTLGGGRIPSTLVQLLVNCIDHQLNIAEATMRPRIYQLDAHNPLELEYAFSEDFIPLLKAKGHQVIRTITMGSTQSIMLENGLFYGAADARRPGAAAIAVD